FPSTPLFRSPPRLELARGQALLVVLGELRPLGLQLLIQRRHERTRPTLLRLVRPRHHLTRQHHPRQHLRALLTREPTVALPQVPLLDAVEPHITESDALLLVVVHRDPRRVSPSETIPHPAGRLLLVLPPRRLPERGVEGVVTPLHVLPGQRRPAHTLIGGRSEERRVGTECVGRVSRRH